jgi:hypothetical protein
MASWGGRRRQGSADRHERKLTLEDKVKLLEDELKAAKTDIAVLKEKVK